MSDIPKLACVAPAAVRYIKLGKGNRWAASCFENGLIYFGYKTVPHEVCLTGDWTGVADFFKQSEGKSTGKAKDCTREMRDFYELGPGCLWITFANEHLWWAFAEPGVAYTGIETDASGPRSRRTVGAWRNTDIAGRPLGLQDLSSVITQVSAYRQTICTVQAADYLVRRINAVGEPVVTQALEARNALRQAALAMIQKLHWADFETMIDLIFARSGWQRISRLGGTQKDLDLVLELPTTGERAAVQIKSRADRATVDDCIANLRRGDFDKVFFVCHSPTGGPEPSSAVQSDANVYVWQGLSLADAAIKAGLFDWLMRRVS